MSLTNPNKVVTEERLSEFYQSILPYLGGMPEALANKFSKSDLYSTDEKIIGQWVDGKPIYQKVFNINVALVWNGQYYAYANINKLVPDVDKIIFAYGYGDKISGELTATYKINDSTWQICLAENYGNIKQILLKYTKTTDTAMPIGNDTDYSTTEKIVGTWIDSKPIYQKTYVVTNTIQMGIDTWSRIFTPPSDLKLLVKFEVNPAATGNCLAWGSVNLLAYISEGDCGKMASSSSDPSLRVIPAGSAFTIQYTKTTD